MSKCRCAIGRKLRFADSLARAVHDIAVVIVALVALWVAATLIALLTLLMPTLVGSSALPQPAVAVMATNISIPISEPVVCQDMALLAQLVSAEARGESFEGQVAVANVVLNRVRSPLFPNTVREVTFQAGQFCAVARLPKVPTDSARRAAEAAMDGFRVVGEDVLFFFNPQTAGCRWIRTREVATTIGRHRFALAQRGR